MADVELDLRNRGIKRRRKRSLDRTEWAAVVSEAKAKLKGCNATEAEEGTSFKINLFLRSDICTLISSLHTGISYT